MFSHVICTVGGHCYNFAPYSEVWKGKTRVVLTKNSTKILLKSHPSFQRIPDIFAKFCGCKSFTTKWLSSHSKYYQYNLRIHNLLAIWRTEYCTHCYSLVLFLVQKQFASRGEYVGVVPIYNLFLPLLSLSIHPSISHALSICVNFFCSWIRFTGYVSFLLSLVFTSNSSFDGINPQSNPFTFTMLNIKTVEYVCNVYRHKVLSMQYSFGVCSKSEIEWTNGR